MINTADVMFESSLLIQNIDNSCINKAKEMFQEYKSRGIIKEGSFEDNVWHCTDEYANVNLDFCFDKFSYKRFYEHVFSMCFEDFINYVKVYITYMIGELVLDTLRNLINDLSKLVTTDINKLHYFSGEVYFIHPNRIISFLSMLPETSDPEQMDRLLNVIEQMEEYLITYTSSRSKRLLASFDSYFLFNDIINDYWNMELDKKDRLFYYPLYLWWQITAVIPLRPREFILTPRQCLNQQKDGWYLTLRRNHLKGSGRKVSYKVDEDYFKVEYRIPDKLAEEILKYIELTHEFESTELDTLFVTDPHYKKWKQKKHSNSRYLTYINLSCIMRYFYCEVIGGIYNLQIIYNREMNHLEKGCIQYIYLGDTRHLSMINIIAEGGTPVLAMLLAGHENIEMSSHYYSNITTLIECRTYKQYRQVLKGNVSYELSIDKQPIMNIKEFSLLEADGKCYSAAYKNGKYCDCKKVAGPTGEIGYCPNCIYYSDSKGEKFVNDDGRYKRKIEDDCKYLSEIINRVRLNNGSNEDILQAMLRLQSSTYTYQQYLEEKSLCDKEET